MKYIYTTDIGASWSSPVTILTHEQSGEVPKVESPLLPSS